MSNLKRSPDDPIGLKTVKGDLLDLLDNGVFDIVAHGCNCFHTMGSGFAGKLVKRYPQALGADQRDSILGDQGKMGTYTQCIVDTPSGKRVRIANIYTQYYYGTGYAGGEHFRLHALKSGLQKLFEDHPGQLIGIPLIGGGLGQGPIQAIRDLIAYFQTRTGNLVLVELPE